MKESKGKIKIDFSLIRDEVNTKDVLQALGIEINKRGKFLCPAHPDKNPSAVVYEDNLWHCYSCGAHGSCIDLVMYSMGTSVRDAALWLGTHYNIGITNESSDFPAVKIDERTNISSTLLTQIGLKENPFRLRHKKGEHYLLLSKLEAADLVRTKCEECIDNEHEFCVKAIKKYPILKENGMAPVLLGQTNDLLAPVRELMSKMDEICNEEQKITLQNPLGLEEEREEERE